MVLSHLFGIDFLFQPWNIATMVYIEWLSLVFTSAACNWFVEQYVRWTICALEIIARLVYIQRLTVCYEVSELQQQIILNVNCTYCVILLIRMYIWN